MTSISVSIFSFPAEDVAKWIALIEQFYHNVEGENITLHIKGRKEPITPIRWSTFFECTRPILARCCNDNTTVTVMTHPVPNTGVFIKTMPREIPWGQLKDLVKHPSSTMEKSVAQAAYHACEMMSERKRAGHTSIEFETIGFNKAFAVSMFPAVLERITRTHEIESFYFNPSVGAGSMLLAFWGNETERDENYHRIPHYIRIERKRCTDRPAVYAFDLEDGFCNSGGMIAPFYREQQDFNKWKREGSDPAKSVLGWHGPFKKLYPKTLKRKRDAGDEGDATGEEKKFRIYCPTH